MQAGAPSSTRNRIGRLSGRVLAMGIISTVGLFMGGCASATSQANMMMFADTAPVAAIVARGTELAAAESAANAQRGCFAVRGEGSSMEPMYVAGTAVVIRAGGYDRLRRGMPVVYENRQGVAVAHMLVERTADGWVAAGLNNDEADAELVTPNNLVGVITQAFASKTGSLPKAVAARIALNDQIRRAGKMASTGTSADAATNNDLL